MDFETFRASFGGEMTGQGDIEWWLCNVRHVPFNDGDVDLHPHQVLQGLPDSRSARQPGMAALHEPDDAPGARHEERHRTRVGQTSRPVVDGLPLLV